MSVDMTKLEPLLLAALNKILTPGELTSEYHAARSSGRLGIALFILGVLGTACGPISDAYAGTHIGIWAGILATVLGAIVKLIASIHYVNGRVDVKSSMSDVLDSVGTIVKIASDATRDQPVAMGPPAPAIVSSAVIGLGQSYGEIETKPDGLSSRGQ